jgi:hypothetical protein
VLVDYTTQNGTAVAPGDYTAKTGTLTFASGETSKSVAVTVVNDTVQEDAEAFNLVLSNPSNATISDTTGVATITDDEAKPTVSIADKSVTEGTGGTNKLAFTVTLSAPSGITTSVKYSTGPDTTTGAIRANAVEDYIAVTGGTITFAPGETSKTADVTVVTDDNDDAPNETLFVDLDPASAPNLAVGDGRAVGTIADDDATPTVHVVNAGAVTEPNDGTNVTTNPPFHVVLSHISNRRIDVNYATVDGTAVNGDDYGTVTGQITFLPGQLRPTAHTCDATTAPDGCIGVSVFGDNLSEAAEDFKLHLSVPDPSDPNKPVTTVGFPDGTGTINDTPDAFPAVSIANAANVTETNGNTASASFTVSLNTPSGQVTSVHYATADGTAKQPGDYASTSGTLTFQAGEVSKNILVPIVGDSFAEPNETFTVTLSAPQQLTLGTATGSATIVNDDGAAVGLSVADVTVTEGTGGTKSAGFVVTLGGSPGQAVTVDYATTDGSATQPADYAQTTGTLTFAVGETTKTINVPIATDSVSEMNETFTLALSNATNASIADGSATATIADDDVVASIAPTSVNEGDAGTATANLVVTLSHASTSTVTVQAATADDTATVAGADYQAASGTVTFAPGETSKNFGVLVNGDTALEPDEAFSVTLSAPTNATLASGGGASAKGTIKDDDTPGALSIGDATVTEGTGGTTNATVTVSLAQASTKTVTVNYATADGTAAAPGDYTPASGTVTFAPGDTTKTIIVAVNPDAIDEANEGFAVNLAGATNATITDPASAVTITDDDASTLSVANAAVTEGTGGTNSAPVVVALSTPSASTVTVSFATADGTATAPGDYTASAGTLTFNPGDTSKTVNVAVNPDSVQESTETFVVNLASPSNAAISDGTSVVTINDDDAPPPPPGTLSVADVTVTEGTGGATTATVTVSLSSAAASNVTVDYATSDGTAKAADYSATTGTLTFAPGEISKTFPVTVNPDSLDENDEKLNVALTNPTNATIGDGAGAVTITDDDATPSIVIGDAMLTEGNANTKLLSFKVTMSAPSGRTVKVNFATANGTATSGSDYVAKSGTLTFAPGQTTKTINVTINGDTTPEANETLSVKLTSPVNVTLADAQAIGTINNDD